MYLNHVMNIMIIKYSLSISTLDHTVKIGMDFTHARFYHVQYKLTYSPGIQIIFRVRRNVWPGVINPSQILTEKVWPVPNFFRQLELKLTT